MYVCECAHLGTQNRFCVTLRMGFPSNYGDGLQSPPHANDVVVDNISDHLSCFARSRDARSNWLLLMAYVG